MWISGYSGVICWKDSLPHWIVLVPLLEIKWLYNFVSISGLSNLFHWSVYQSLYQPVPHCTDFFSFIINLEVRYCKSPNFVIFQVCFGYAEDFAFLLAQFLKWKCFLYFGPDPKHPSLSTCRQVKLRQKPDPSKSPGIGRGGQLWDWADIYCPSYILLIGTGICANHRLFTPLLPKAALAFGTCRRFWYHSAVFI